MNKIKCLYMILLLGAVMSGRIAEASPRAIIAIMGAPGVTIPVFPLVKTPPESSEPALPGGEPGTPRFHIRKFNVVGNTLLDSEQVAALLDKFTGKMRDFADVQMALEALEDAYRDRGYSSVTVNLPEQDMKNGIITFVVIEPKIRSIKVEGNRHLTQGNIINSFPTLVVGRTPLIQDVSNNLRSVNENPAKKVSLQLQNGSRDDEIRALLKVTDDRPWKLGLTFDNTGNRTTGYYRLGMLLQYFNLHNLDHVASIQYTTSPDHIDMVNSLSASYRVPLYRLGDTVDIFAGYSNTDSGSMNIQTNDFSYTASNINGTGVVSGIRYNYTLKRFGEYAQKLVAGFDYRLYENSSDFALDIANGASMTGKNSSRLVLHPLSITYNGTYTGDGVEAGFYLGGIYNIPWGEHGRRSDFPEGSTPDYLIFRSGANLGTVLPADWQARFTVSGQYSDDSLTAYEQLGLGGPASGRGYNDRAAAGNNGIAWSAEIYSPDLAKLLRLSQSQVRLVGFYDDGYVFRPRGAAAAVGDTRLASIGSGIRVAVSKYFNLSADWGFTLNKTATAPSGENRLHFKAALLY